MRFTHGWLVLGVLALSGCGFGRAQNPFDVHDGGGTSLTVNNEHPQDVRISLVRRDVAIPVGRVRALEATVLKLDRRQVPSIGLIQFEITESPGGTAPVMTSPVLAGPGHPISLRVNHGLERSTAIGS